MSSGLLSLKNLQNFTELEFILSSLINLKTTKMNKYIKFSEFDLYLKLFYTSYKNNSVDMSAKCLKFLIKASLNYIYKKEHIGTL